MADVPLKAREGVGSVISKSTRHIEPFGLLASATSPAWKSRTALNPFRTKAESLGILAFIHPPGDGAPSQIGHRFRGIAIFRT
jgi:hypothetical protein